MNNNETPRETLSKRKPLRFWGWGYDHEELTTDETQLIDAMVKTLQDHAKASIAPYKYPREVEFVTALPRTETGKLQRFKLRQQT